ncbi:rCG62260 [Rattus norvegicus]|uniref:RCG62260 n=1 Tax=Rattus norvegicus TaxID=10116 RepID=A6H9F7_RAT|nr:rCG62260 [Rattus norvegicus]
MNAESGHLTINKPADILVTYGPLGILVSVC